METGAEFEDWVNERPEAVRQRDGLWVAHRAAARSLPLLWKHQAGAAETAHIHEIGPTALCMLRCMLTAEAVIRSPTRELKDASGFARYWLDGLGNTYSAEARSVRAVVRGGAAARVAVDGADAAVNSVEAIVGGVPAFTSAMAWQQISNDAQLIAMLEDSEPHYQLWTGTPPEWFAGAVVDMQSEWDLAPQAIRDLWARWWNGVMSGHHLDWELQRRVAMVPTRIWEMGPDAIAKEISKIDEIVSLLKRVDDLRTKLLVAEAQIQSPTEDLLRRIHNQPPEVVDQVAELSAEVSIALQALDKAVEELAKPEPDPSTLQRIGSILWRTGKAILQYCAGLADLALTKAAEELGPTGVKWTFRAFAAYLAAQSPHMQALGKDILDLFLKLRSGG